MLSLHSANLPHFLNVTAIHIACQSCIIMSHVTPGNIHLAPRKSASINSKPNALGCPCQGGWQTWEWISSAVSVRLVSLHPTYRVMMGHGIYASSISMYQSLSLAPIIFQVLVPKNRRCDQSLDSKILNRTKSPTWHCGSRGLMLPESQAEFAQPTLNHWTTSALALQLASCLWWRKTSRLNFLNLVGQCMARRGSLLPYSTWPHGSKWLLVLMINGKCIDSDTWWKSFLVQRCVSHSKTVLSSVKFGCPCAVCSVHITFLFVHFRDYYDLVGGPLTLTLTLWVKSKACWEHRVSSQLMKPYPVSSLNDLIRPSYLFAWRFEESEEQNLPLPMLSFWQDFVGHFTWSVSVRVLFSGGLWPCERKGSSHEPLKNYWHFMHFTFEANFEFCKI